MEKNRLKDLLLNHTREEIQEEIDDIHPADLLELLEETEDEDQRRELLNDIPDDIVADIVEEMDDEDDQYEFLHMFPKNRRKEILDEMSDDELTDLVGELDEEEGREVLSELEPDDQQQVKQLLSYDPETAGGIMTTEYVYIFAKNTVADTLKYLQSVEDEEEIKSYLYVVDALDHLKGVVALRDIVRSSFETKMMDIINDNVIAINYKEDQEEVANTFKKYGYSLMPVVDDDNKMLGIIEIDDILDVMEEETTEDMNLMAGMDSEEDVDSTLSESFKSRIPWLVVNLATAVLAAAVVNNFSGTIEKVVSLSAVMSIVTGMGGNAGTQSLTILVRGLSLNEVTKDNALRIFLKELGVGVLTGIVIGIIVGIGSTIFAHNPWFGVVAALAMLLNMIAANFAGYLVPVILKKMHIDPALASGVFVTTVTDCLGFFFFLGLATMFLPLLVQKDECSVHLFLFVIEKAFSLKENAFYRYYFLNLEANCISWSLEILKRSHKSSSI